MKKDNPFPYQDNNQNLLYFVEVSYMKSVVYHEALNQNEAGNTNKYRSYSEWLHKSL